MKKHICIVLVITILAAMFTGCGSGEKNEFTVGVC